MLQVPKDTASYLEQIADKGPLNFERIRTKLSSGSYLAEDGSVAEAFTKDVRLVLSRALACRPKEDDDCHKAAKSNLVAFEKALLDAGLAKDGGAALRAAEASAKPSAPSKPRGAKRARE